LKSLKSEEICDFGGFLKSRLCNGVQRNDAKTGKIALNRIHRIQWVRQAAGAFKFWPIGATRGRTSR